MRSTAQHIHKDGTRCWFDFGLDGWFTQLPAGQYPEPWLFTGKNVTCPKPRERGLVETGEREVPLLEPTA